MLYDISVDSHYIGGRPRKHVTVLAKETQKLRLVLLVGFGVDAYSFGRDSWVQRYLLELAFSLYDLSAFCQRLSFVLLWLHSQKMHILVASCDALLDVSGFLLATKDGYDSKSCWYF
jgi:hypothetical protein